MATHSSVLAWRIPGTGEPGRLLFMGLHRVGHDWSNLAAAAAAMAQALYRHHLFSCPDNPTCVITYKFCRVSHDTNPWRILMEFSKLIVKFTWKRNSSHRARTVLGRKTVMGMGGLPLRCRAGVIIAEHCIRMKSPERQKCRIGGLACF